MYKDNPWDDPYEYAQLFCERNLLITLVEDAQYSFDRMSSHPRMKIYPEEIILAAALKLNRQGYIQFHESIEDSVFEIRYFDGVTDKGNKLYEFIKSGESWRRYIAESEKNRIRPEDVINQYQFQG